MNYSKGTENIAFDVLNSASATWEVTARQANSSGVVMDSAEYSTNFFAADTREIKEQDITARSTSSSTSTPTKVKVDTLKIKK